MNTRTDPATGRAAPIPAHAILVGVDGPEPPAATVDLAATEAALRGLSLVLIAAHPFHAGDGPHTGITASLHRVCAVWPELAATARNVTGELAEHLIAESRSANLVVVGQEYPRQEVAQIAAHSRCPTLVVPPLAAGHPDGPVLVGLGMTTDDEPAIGFAFEEAALRRVPLLAVHVWSGIPAAAVGVVSPFAYDLRVAQSAADRMLAHELAGWVEKYPEVRVERMPLYDVNPAYTLLEAASLAGLVVVGGHRRSLGGSQLLGSVTRTLLARSPRPVAVVSHPTR